MINTAIEKTEEMKDNKNLPQGWVESELKDLGKIVAGGTPSTSDLENFNGEIAWLTPADLSKYEGKYISKGERNITEKGLNSSSAKLMPAGSILFSSRAPIGYVVIASNEICTNQGFKNIIPSKFVFNEYIYYYLKTSKNLAEKIASGTTFKEISGTKFGGLPIPLAPLAEQERIVEKIEELFSDIDDGIKTLEKTKLQIKQYHQSVLKSAFEGSLYKTTEWKLSTLGEVIQPRRTRINPNSENGDIVFIGMDCISPNCLNIHKKYKLRETKSTAFVFEKNDVLYGRMRSYLNKVFKANFNGTASAEFIVLPENDNMHPDFLKYLLHQQKFVRFASRNASGDRPRVGFESDLQQYEFLLPKKDEQQKIVEEIEKRFEVADGLEKAVNEGLEKAKQLKQSILKKAFEGKLVPQNPNDEPASILLEKIKSERSKK